MSRQSQESDSERVNASIATRAVCAEDEAFLLKLYASTRREEFAALPWTETQLEAFLRIQFVAQSRGYAAQFAAADHRLILFNDELAGQIMIDRTGAEIHLVDISLLTEYRNKGIGAILVGNLLAEAEQEGRSVVLKVWHNNPDRHLYERLGFSKTGDHDLYSQMEWRPKNCSESL